ncbi:MAG: hypothetical protein ABEJ79_02295 [Halolamina sp.]
MPVALRLLDDGAWVSVNDERRVAVGELWRVDDPEACACRRPDFAVEGFVDCGVADRHVTATAYGTCIACGSSLTVAGVPVGRIVEGEFRSLAREELLLRPVGDADE